MPAISSPSLDGNIVYPGDPGYDHDRQDFDNLYPAFPQLIVYAASVADVAWAIQYAQTQQLAFAVRSGGHSTAGYSVCDGLVLDLSKLHAVDIDLSAQTARVGTGCNFERLNLLLEAQGLHVPGGGCPTVAVAGYMMGGGYGFTSRTFGMNCDNVLAVSVMLADCTVVTADADTHPDLFWAIRGGTGGNFGVLLDITYRVYPLGDIRGIQLQWPLDTQLTNAAQAMYVVQQAYLIDAQHPELGIEYAAGTDLKDGIKKLSFCATYTGDPTQLNSVLAPLLAVPGYTITRQPSGRYSQVNRQLLSNVDGDLPPGIMAFSRSAYVERLLQPADYQAILQYFVDTAPNQYTTLGIECYGGVINQVPTDAMAFRHRSVLFDLFADAFFDSSTADRPRNRAWITEFFTFLRAYGNGHSYQNYPDRAQADFRWAYWGDAYPRLQTIKSTYDPDQFFNYQQAICG